MSRDKGKHVVVIDADLEELVPGFLASRQSDLDKIASATARRDYEALRQIGHNLKGLGGGYGFPAISEIGAAFEQAATAEQHEELVRLTKALRDYLLTIEIVFE